MTTGNAMFCLRTALAAIAHIQPFVFMINALIMDIVLLTTLVFAMIVKRMAIAVIPPNALKMACVTASLKGVRAKTAPIKPNASIILENCPAGGRVRHP